MKLITEDKMHLYLLDYVQHFNTQKEAAESLGVSQQYLGDIIAQRRSISDRVATNLGYDRVTMYRAQE